MFGSVTFSVEDLLLRSILLIDTVELEAIFFGEVLGVGDLDDRGLPIWPLVATHDLIIGIFGFKEGSNSGDDSDTHFGPEVLVYVLVLTRP